MGDGPEGVPAVPPHMKPVGINYPWLKYGWDFGDPPPKWIKKKDWKKKDWKSEVKKDIEELKKLGICVLRWFILADGLTYGIDDQAPYQDPKRKGQWRFDDPPKLTTQFEEDFNWVLETLQNNNMQFVPSLIDFHLCFPGTEVKDKKGVSPFVKRGVKGGRSDVINDISKREKFFNRVLKPLLNISKKYRETIYAWELVNEPEGATIGSGEGEEGEGKATVKKKKMLDFIEQGIGLINDAKFKSTVGYRRLETIKNWRSKKRKFLGVTLHQFHFYPKGRWYDFIPWFRDDLPKHFFHKEWPCFIGEFATALEGKFQWPELNANQTVYDRLNLIEKKGYPVAFPWAMIKRSKKKYKKKIPAHDWSDLTKESIKKYIFKRP